MAVFEGQAKALREWYRKLLSSTIKRKLSAELLENIEGVLENREFLKFLLDGCTHYEWKSFIVDSAYAAIKEMKENGSAKTSRSFRRNAFTAFKTVVSFHCESASEGPSRRIFISDVLDVLLNLIRYPLEAGVGDDVVSLIRSVRSESMELLSRVLRSFQSGNVKPRLLKGIWTEAAEMCEELLKGRKEPSTRRACSRVMVEVAHVVHLSLYAYRFEELFTTIASLLNMSISQKSRKELDKDEMTTNFLRIANILMNIFAVAKRNFVTQVFSNFLENLFEENSTAWSKESFLWGDRVFLDENSDLYQHQEALFEFVDRFLALCCPDCVVAFLPSTSSGLLKSTVKAVVTATLDYVKEHCAPEKAVYRKGGVLLEKKALALPARSFTIQHLLPEEKGVKRRKTTDPLIDLVGSSSVCGLQVFEATLNLWGHRISKELKIAAFQELITSSAKIKKEEVLDWIIKAMIAVADEAVVRLTDASSCSSLWKFSISMLHSPRSSHSACRLLSRIVVPCSQSLKLSDDLVVQLVTGNICRLISCSRPAVELLAVVMSEFEFDERRTFRLGDRDSCPEWRFRSEALEFILSSTVPSSVPREAVLQICCYSPLFTLPSTGQREMNDMERTLMQLFAIGNCEDIKKEKGNGENSFFVPELVQCLTENLETQWQLLEQNGSQNDSDDKYLREVKWAELWNLAHTLLCLFRRRSANLDLSSLERLCESWSSLIATLIREHGSVAQLVSALDVGDAWTAVTADVKDAICNSCKNFPLLTSLAMRFGHHFDLSYLMQWLSSQENMVSGCGQYALRAARENPSVEDAVPIFERFAPYMTCEEKKQFVQIFGIPGASTSQSQSGSSQSEETLQNRLIADIILKHSTEEELVELKEAVVEGSPFLLAARSSLVWLSGNEIFSLLALDTLEEEVRARFAYSVLSSAAAHGIHVRVLAFLIDTGSSTLYTHIKTMIPHFDETVALLKTPLVFFFHRKAISVVSSSFFPSCLLRLVSQAAEQEKNTINSFTAFVSGTSQYFEQKFIRDIFLLETKSLKQLFARQSSLDSLYDYLLKYPCWFFLEMKALYETCASFGYELLVIRSLNFLLTSMPHSSFSSCLKKFIVRNCITLVSITVRSYAPKSSKQEVADLLEQWLCVHELLVDVDRDTAAQLSFIVFDVFLKFEQLEKRLLSVPLIDDYLSSYGDSHLREILTASSDSGTLLTEGYWKKLQYHLFENKKFKLNEDELQKIIRLWARYKPLRRSMCAVLSQSHSESVGALFGYSDHSVSLNEFIINSLIEIFFDPFTAVPLMVYESICKILSSEWLHSSDTAECFVEPVNDDCMSALKAVMTDGIKWNKANFICESVDLFLSSLEICQRPYLMVVAASIESFATSLLPFLVEIAFTSGNGCLEKFCDDVNTLLRANHPSLFAESCPIITCIVSCLRRLRTSAATHDFRSKFPIDLLSLAEACLKADLVEDAYYFLRCYIDLESDGIRTAAYLFGEGRGMLEVLVTQSQISTRNNVECLLMRNLVALRDSHSLRAFSLRATELPSCRTILAETSCQWQHLASICEAYATDCNSFLRSRALFYCGAQLEALDRDAQYRAAAELTEWDRLSYPKKGSNFSSSHWLYSILYTRQRQEWDLSGQLSRRYTTDFAEKVAKLEIVSQGVIKELKEAFEVKWLMEHPDAMPTDPQLCYSWLSSKYHKTMTFPVEDAVPLIVSHAQLLFSIKAYQPALRLIEKFRERVNACFSGSWECDVERARILDVCGEREAARSILMRIVSADGVNDTGADISAHMVELLLNARSMLAEFDIRDCRSDLAINHLQKAINFARENLDVVKEEQMVRVYRELATYAEKQYLSLEEYRSSDAYKTKESAVKKWREELSKIDSENELARNHTVALERKKEAQRRRLIMEKNSEEEDLKQFKTDLNRQITLAMDSYLNILEIGISTEDIPYRLLPILVNVKYDEPLLKIAKDRIGRIAARHWVPLVNHLCCHLFDGSPLSHVVRGILLKTVREFPFHAVNHLLFYAAGSQQQNEEAKARKEKVYELLREVCRECTSLAKPISDLQRAFRIYCNFAATDIAAYKNNNQSRNKVVLDDSCIIIKERAFLQSIPVPAITQVLSGKLSDMVTFGKIFEEASVADGLSKPTVLTILGSDGMRRKLIFKNEDLREDSLVEQLFSVVNLLLNERPNPAPLRTYHVLPLNSSAGIIEWCLQTMSLCEYLCGMDRQSGAHRRYYPDDMTALKARVELGKIRKDGGDLLVGFEQICRRIHPVFRHFFYERFHDPKEWYQRVHNYTISLAHWSIVGYVVGLGDRHLSNILIDLETAQLVHIDLGMVFEFGKRNLPIPERVPFRLSRDMVDPILVEGVNGKFKAIAVGTMEHLRNNSQALIGLALMLLNDPLCSLSGSENKRHFSSLAICRLRDKLAGIENRVYMNSEQQVSHLIKEASDPENLCRMFVGWMPFL